MNKTSGRWIRIFVTVALLALARPAVADWSLTTVENDQVRWMFTLASQRDEAGLLEVGKHLTGNKYVIDLYPWALWLVNHDKYRSRFLNSFPLDDQGFIACTMDAIQVHYPFPYAYYTLGEYASQGDTTAIRKMIEAKTDGAIAEYQVAVVDQTAISAPHAVLIAMRGIDAKSQLIVLCGPARDRFLSTKPANATEASQIDHYRKVIAQKCPVIGPSSDKSY